MCLIFIAHRAHPRFPLVVAANRDELYARPTAPASFWDGGSEVLAGRDLQGGGTWLGMTRGGRFAALTNFRSPEEQLTDAPTRGALVSRFLEGDSAPADYLDDVSARGASYNGFNLLVGGVGALWWYSNRADRPHELAPGIYGISNHLLDTPWPKVARGKRELARLLDAGELDAERLLELLSRREHARDGELPDTGVGIEWERVFSPVFVVSEHYGTRSSTALVVEACGRVRFVERTHEAGSLDASTASFAFELDAIPSLP